MRVTSQRGGGRRRAASVPGLAATPRRGAAWLLGLGAALLLGALAGCFHPGFLAYAACDSSEPCVDAGLYGCVIVPEAQGRRGFCAVACEGDTGCPDPDTGTAQSRCARVGSADVCVLSCMDEETCPDGQVCTEVGGVDGGAARLCFPAVQP